VGTFDRVQVGATALALPAGATLALLLVRGGAVFDGPAAASFAVLAATGLAGLGAVAAAALLRRGRSTTAATLRSLPPPLPSQIRTVASATRRPVPSSPLTEHLSLSAKTAPGREVAGREALGRPAGENRSAAEEHDRALAGIAAGLREPLVRASTAASMLRLVLPAPPAAALRELLRVEEDLAVAERRLAALVAAGERGRRAPRPIDLAAVAAEIARTLSLPAGVQVRWHAEPGEPAVALADEGRLRPALREAIRGAAATLLPHGGEVRLRAAQRAGEVTLEIAADGFHGSRGTWLPFVRALLGPADARVEDESVPGRGSVCRIVLRAAPPDVLEDAEIRLISDP
jgi:signal transduction histidine kinase